MDADAGSDPVRVLDPEECWRLLRSAPMGRIALAAGGEVDIFPINFAVDGQTIYFRTAPGTKLLELTARDTVALEIDGWDDDHAYSVVVKARAHELQHGTEIEAAERLGLAPWVPTLKYRWVRIEPDSVSGRWFPRAPEPERD